MVLLQHHFRHHPAQPVDRHHEREHQQCPHEQYRRLEVPENSSLDGILQSSGTLYNVKLNRFLDIGKNAKAVEISHKHEMLFNFGKLKVSHICFQII